eukprot:g12836.t1
MTTPEYENSPMSRILHDDDDLLKKMKDQHNQSTDPTTTWNKNSSVFKSRKKKSESRDVYDTSKVTDKCFDIDWRRCVGQKTMTNVFQIHDEEALKKEIKEIKEAVKRRYRHIMDVFTMFAASSRGDPACMDSTDWRKFCDLTHIMGPKTNSNYLNEVFTLVNEEDDPDSLEGQINPDKLLMRYEFLEILLRVAMQKYFEGDPSDAVNLFFDNHFKYLKDEHAHDRDQFRKSRLYNDAVEAVFKKYLRQLKYFFAQKADRVKFISWDSWRKFLESTHLIDSEFSRRQAGLVFQWSKMRTSDEIKSHQNNELIDFVGFLEMIARIADYKSFPTQKELNEAGYTFFSDYQKAWKTNARLWLGRRPSAGGFEKTKTQPLAYKLSCFLEYWCAMGWLPK